MPLTLDKHPEQIGGGMPLLEFDFQNTGLPVIYGKADLAISKLILGIKNKREKTARSRGSFFISFLFSFLSIKETLHRREVTDQ